MIFYISHLETTGLLARERDPLNENGWLAGSVDAVGCITDCWDVVGIEMKCAQKEQWRLEAMEIARELGKVVSVRVSEDFMTESDECNSFFARVIRIARIAASYCIMLQFWASREFCTLWPMFTK